MENNAPSSRRKFIRNTSMVAALSLGIPQLLAAADKEEKFKGKVKLSPNDIILFQGDSITDGSRKKDSPEANNAAALGSGYAMLAAAEVLHHNAQKNLKIFNRGISGNKVFQLAERWQKDTIELQPDVLSILIGVNDFWHMIQGRYSGTVTTYADDLRKLLKNTKEKLPHIKLIIGEPFAVNGIKAVDDKWFPAFDEYRRAAKQIATEFDAVFIPYQTIFNKAQEKAPGVYWTFDGVHPSLAGAQLMATAWVEAVGK